MRILQSAILILIGGLFVTCDNDQPTEESQDFEPGRFYKSEKIGFFTEQMNLTEKEALKFWPIYNTYSQKRDSLWRAQRSFLIKYSEEKLDAESSEAALTRFLKFEQHRDQIRDDYIAKLRSFMSDEKILQMFYTEHQFKHFMLNRIRGRHGFKRGGRGRGMRKGFEKGGASNEDIRPMVPPHMNIPNCFH